MREIGIRKKFVIALRIFPALIRLTVYRRREVIFLDCGAKQFLPFSRQGALSSKIMGSSRDSFFRFQTDFFMVSKKVRSTLLHLPARGPLRAKSGGPPVTLFFRL